jgi:hypothetical protein
MKQTTIENGYDFITRAVKDIGGKDTWTDVGVAHQNDRGSITVYLAALPLNDKLLLIPEPGVQMDETEQYWVRLVKDVGGKDKWYDIGVAYKNSRSITIYFHALPLNDKFMLIPTK